jgi:hypothetical protein
MPPPPAQTSLQAGDHGAAGDTTNPAAPAEPVTAAGGGWGSPQPASTSGGWGSRASSQHDGQPRAQGGWGSRVDSQQSDGSWGAAAAAAAARRTDRARYRGGTGEFIGGDQIHVGAASGRQLQNQGYVPFGGNGNVAAAAARHADATQAMAHREHSPNNDGADDLYTEDEEQSTASCSDFDEPEPEPDYSPELAGEIRRQVCHYFSDSALLRREGDQTMALIEADRDRGGAGWVKLRELHEYPNLRDLFVSRETIAAALAAPSHGTFVELSPDR